MARAFELRSTADKVRQTGFVEISIEAGILRGGLSQLNPHGVKR
jgi:hypothetical protein